MKQGGFRTVSGRQPVPQANRTSAIRKQPGVASSFVNSTSTQPNGFNQQPSSFSTNQTFWTICTSCGVRYQYYQRLMNRELRCQTCKKPCTAYDISAHSVPSAAPWNRNGIPQQEKRAPTGHFTGPKCNFGTGSDVGSQRNVGGGSAEAHPCSRSDFNAEFVGASNINSKENVKVDMDSGTANDVKFERVKFQGVNKRDQAVMNSTENRSQKSGRKITVESSESERNSDVVVGNNYLSGQNTGTSGSCPRRSSRQKQDISNNEDQSDDDEFVRPKHKKSRTGSMSGNTEQNDPDCINGQSSEAAAATGGKGGIGEGWASSESLPNGLQKTEHVRNDKEQGLNAGASSKASAGVDFIYEALPDDPEGYIYPDSEFHNFEGGRDESTFAVDQIWAIYDNSDAMPRYYALIRHVYGPKFKLRFNWLDYEPKSEAETLWYGGGLPIGCGTFKRGKTELTHERLMFSHRMPWKKGIKKNAYDILPRKGEVWAVFKNWDIEWSSCVDTNRHSEYEIVEVISDFTEGRVISVVRLVKVQGFVSLFVQAIDSRSSRLNIQCKDILRFSHNIPAYRLKGNERECVPKGSLELDCASLPLNFADMFPSVNVESVLRRAEDQSDDDEFVRPKHKKSRTGSMSGNTEQNDPNCINGQSSEAAAAAGGKGSIGEGWASSESLPNGLQKTEHVRNDKEQGLNAGASSKASAGVDFIYEALPDDPEGYIYPDSEFHNFEGGRDESTFAVDQIWAIYDNSDAMPRYYALIRHVYGPKFKLRFNWLDYEPKSEAETLWYGGGLPIGCGTFKRGKTELTHDRLMFSHRMPWKKGIKKNAYDILPRKGEVWAVFKNWDIEWSSCVDTNMHYEYEIVEVISDFTEGRVISVVRLVKVQGFVSLFVQAIDSRSSRLNIQCKDILRFSHNIPAYRLKGNERECIPKGSLELDCASLPLNFADMFPSVNVESVLRRAEDLNNVCNGLHSKSAGCKDDVPTRTTIKRSPEVNKNGVAGGSKCYAESETTCKEEVGTEEDARDPSTRPDVKNHTVSQQSSSIITLYDYPDSEFHNFEEERSAGKFEEGQIWALYSDVDKNPNYYGQISKVQLERFEVHVRWLDGYPEQEHEKLWFKGQLPVGCGSFKVSRETIVSNTTDAFSHLVHAKPTSKKNHYDIYPHIGEIWAVYKKWSIGWSHSDHENCDFNLVEIIATDSSGFKVLVLSKVKGYVAVFKAETGVSSRTMHIPFGELLKFSHKILSFRLTGERGGMLGGYWELDPAAVPDVLVVTDST